ncbi:conserved hypothetical protein, partial [Ricinus communis]
MADLGGPQPAGPAGLRHSRPGLGRGAGALRRRRRPDRALQRRAGRAPPQRRRARPLHAARGAGPAADGHSAARRARGQRRAILLRAAGARRRARARAPPGRQRPPLRRPRAAPRLGGAVRQRTDRAGALSRGADARGRRERPSGRAPAGGDDGQRLARPGHRGDAARLAAGRRAAAAPGPAAGAGHPAARRQRGDGLSRRRSAAMSEGVLPQLRNLLVQRYEQIRQSLTIKLGNADLAGDALHEVWLRLQRDPTISGPVQNPQAYLVRMGINLAIDVQRSQSKLMSTEEVEELMQALPDPAPGPAELAELRSEMD